MEKVSANSPLPSIDVKDPHVKHLELNIKRSQVEEVMAKLQQISGYYFGVSVRKCGFNQRTIIIVKYSKKAKAKDDS